MDTKRVKEAHKYFGFYGRGNFDLYTEDILELLTIMDSDNYKQQLKQLYARLEKQRMG